MIPLFRLELQPQQAESFALSYQSNSEAFGGPLVWVFAQRGTGGPNDTLLWQIDESIRQAVKFGLYEVEKYGWT
jgi:hypothetical protein